MYKKISPGIYYISGDISLKDLNYLPKSYIIWEMEEKDGRSMRTFDYSILKNENWDSEVLGLVAQIHEYKGRQELYLRQKPEKLDKLVELAKIQTEL